MRRVALGVGAALTVGGFWLATTALSDALATRRVLVAELSAASGAGRSLGALGQQLRAEAGTAKSAATLIDEATLDAHTADHRRALAAVRACLDDGGCGAPEPLLTQVEAGPLATVTGAWARVDEAEARTHGATRLAVGLLVMGLVMMLGGALRRAAPPAPARRQESADNEALQRVLRERLEALYAARTQLGEGARFGAFGELAAALSHGLKTPLAGISASVQLANLKLGETNAAKGELEEVLRLTEALTEQLQRFLRAAGQVGSTRQTVAVSALLSQVGDAYGQTASARGLALETRDETAGVQLEVDAPLLDMAVRNLVENALSSGGKRVTVSARLTEPPARVGLDGGAPGPGSWVALTVDDDGPGLPTAARRTEPGVTTRAAGSGLGLAIARRVAERHGGALLLEDAPSGGARVAVVLPAAKRKA